MRADGRDNRRRAGVSKSQAMADGRFIAPDGRGTT
jgi:hypothetical protein